MKQVTLNDLRVGDKVEVREFIPKWATGLDVEVVRKFVINSEGSLESVRTFFSTPKVEVLLVERPDPLKELVETVQRGYGDDGYLGVALSVVTKWETFTPEQKAEVLK